VQPVVLIGALLALPAQEERQSDKDKKKTSREFMTEYGRAARSSPEPTDAGVWDGTWYYVNRDIRVAIWLKTEKGKPKIKLRYAGSATLEGFITDWDGTAEYEFREKPGTFSLNIKKRDKDRIVGRWEWKLQLGKNARIEEGDYTLFRTGDGRFMVLEFDEYVRTLRTSKGDRVYRTHPAWTFRKASKRLVLWDELPM